MNIKCLLAFVGLFVWAGEAQAFDYFSIGSPNILSPGDPGIAPYEFMAVTFDKPSAWFVAETDSLGPAKPKIYRGTTLNVAAAPALDTTKYQAVAPGQSAMFTFGSVAPLIHTISFYFGSIDAYNIVNIVDKKGNVIGSVLGTQWPQFNGDQFSGGSNRRVYLTNLPSDFFGIQFISTGIAEEYDSIAVSNGIPCFSNTPPCVKDGGIYLKMPGATSPRAIPIPGSPPPFGVSSITVPEPRDWVLMLAGFGWLGFSLRGHRRGRRTAI